MSNRLFGCLCIVNMNRQSTKRYKKICSISLYILAITLSISLLGLFIGNLLLNRQIQVCGNRNGMTGWVLINRDCYTVVDNITFNDLIVYCAKHHSIIPNALDRNEVLVVSSILDVKSYWMPFIRKRGNWFYGKVPIEVKGDPNLRASLGKSRNPDNSENCSVYNNGILEEFCNKKHKGICFTQF
ncbi:ORF-131 [Teiidae poxvirus 1]|nr:ORF-131 [Teiidae poxvirus 1]